LLQGIWLYYDKLIVVSVSKDDADMTQESIESIFGINAGIVWNALSETAAAHPAASRRGIQGAAA
jgi:hypothetical protein